MKSNCSIDCAKKYVENLISVALATLPRYFPKPLVIWKPMGVRAAGYAVCDDNTILLNSNYLSSDDWECFLNRTPIHELAHLVAYKFYNDRGHGSYWKKVCVDFGIEPTRCHNYKRPKTQTGTRVVKYYPAHCNCRHHKLSSTRYNRMVNDGQIYLCRSCKSVLELD